LFGDAPLTSKHEEYLDFLTTCDLSKLAKEPDILRGELEKVEEEMKNTVVTDYKSFIQASQCIHNLNTSAENLAKSLKALTASLAPLPNNCNNFSRSAIPLKLEREKNKLTLDKHEKMLELLKIPQLMEKRVKQGSYEEVLQLQQFAKQLEKKHGKIPIISSIGKDVDAQISIMRDMLHKNLRGNIKVHQCLENISYLRRLEIYSDTELRIIFLKSRDSWLYLQKSRLSPKNAFSYLNKLIDLTRDHLYEVITQYRIIFSDASPESNANEVGGKNESSILSSWVVHRVEEFVSELEKFLARVNEGSSIRNLMELSISISRVGVDISGFLPPIFETHVTRMFSGFLQTGTKYFSESIKTDAIISAAKARNPLLIERKESMAPNRILLEVPPLAVLTNSYLHALNELRQCGLITIRSRLAGILYNELEKVVENIASQKSISRSTRQQEFSQMAQVAAEHFVPYMEKCFNHIFQSSSTLLDTAPLLDKLGELFEK